MDSAHHVLTWLAQEDPLPPEWVNQGALGLVILALVTGWLWTKPAVDRLIRDLERCQQEVLQRLDRIIRLLEDRDE